MKLATVCTCIVWAAAIAGCVYLTTLGYWGMGLVVLLAGLSVSLRGAP